MKSVDSVDQGFIVRLEISLTDEGKLAGDLVPMKLLKTRVLWFMTNAKSDTVIQKARQMVMTSIANSNIPSSWIVITLKTELMRYPLVGDEVLRETMAYDLKLKEWFNISNMVPDPSNPANITNDTMVINETIDNAADVSNVGVNLDNVVIDTTILDPIVTTEIITDPTVTSNLLNG